MGHKNIFLFLFGKMSDKKKPLLNIRGSFFAPFGKKLMTYDR